MTGARALAPAGNELAGASVENGAVTELPLNGRNPLALVALVPGVVPQGQPSAGNSSTGNPVGANPFALEIFRSAEAWPGRARS